MSKGRKPFVPAMYGTGGDPIDDELCDQLNKEPSMGSNLHPTIAQALAAFAPPQSEVHREPVTRWNDDDLYEFDAHTFELFRQHSPQRADLQHLMRGAPSGVAMLHDGHSLARGAKVKHLGLWQRRKFDDVPAFLMRGAA